MPDNENNYVIMTDATADLPRGYESKIEILPMTVQVDGTPTEYRGDWDERRAAAFYQKLRDGAVAVTSQIAPLVYERAFEEAFAAGRDILYLCFSSGMSGTIQPAALAAEAAREKYPERQIEIVDSLSATYGEGMQAAALADNRRRGMALSENAAWMRLHTHEFASWFTVEDLMYLHRGGRLSKLAALVGTTLHLKPVLHIDQKGKLALTDKAQGRKVSLRALARKAHDTALPGENPLVCIGHCDCEADALLTEKLICAALPGARTCVGYFSPVIGAHTGPGAVSVFFRASEK